MDEIKNRLRETSDDCLKAYEAWSSDKKNGKAREALQESVHELRKVASRLEIEIAISERQEMTQKPIPIPPHRDARKRNRDHDDNFGNGNNDQQPKQNKPQRKGPPKKAASGGDQQ